MKFVYMLILINTTLSMASSPTASSPMVPSPMAVQSRTRSIYYRYYLIKRLEQSCLLLQHASVQQIIPFDRLDEAVFKSESIRSIVERMKAEKSTAPFLSLWSDFCDYKDIYNDLFKHEFIELVYIVYDLMYPTRMKRSNGLLSGGLLSGRSPEYTLFAIDCAVDAERYNDCSFRAQPREFAEVDTDRVANRFYIIKRLQKSMQLLAHLHEQKIDFTDGLSLRNDTFGLIQEIEQFHHDRVRESVMQMCQTKNLEPLLRLCDEVKQYRFAQDEDFLQEMLMNIFLVYKTILLKHGSHHADQEIMYEMAHVLDIYEHLNSMPLDQTLEAIDIVTDKLMAIQAEELALRPHYMYPALAGSFCALVGIGAYYYFTHQG